MDKPDYERDIEAKFELINAIADALRLNHRVEGTADTLTTTGLKSQYFSKYHLAADWGYKPRYSSTQGILAELRAMLGNTAIANG